MTEKKLKKILTVREKVKILENQIYALEYFREHSNEKPKDEVTVTFRDEVFYAQITLSHEESRNLINAIIPIIESQLEEKRKMFQDL